jgi:SAM-dependent methyltransferase
MNAANRATPAFLADAGIAPGMRVLDLGCAFGELTRLVARMVGPDGAVTGVDRNRAYLAQARGTAAEPDAGPIHYVEADLTGDLGARADPPFDAIVIRRVLMYLPDPEGLIARLPALLTPGGLLAVQEHDATGLPISTAPLPLHREAHRWVWDTVVAEGGRRTMGMTLPGMLEAAGWTIASWRAEATLIGAREASWLGHAVRGMLPRMIAGGVVTEGEIDLDTLDARLVAERREADAALVWDMAHMIAARAPV